MTLFPKSKCCFTTEQEIRSGPVMADVFFHLRVSSEPTMPLLAAEWSLKQGHTHAQSHESAAWFRCVFRGSGVQPFGLTIRRHWSHNTQYFHCLMLCYWSDAELVWVVPQILWQKWCISHSCRAVRSWKTAILDIGITCSASEQINGVIILIMKYHIGYSMCTFHKTIWIQCAPLILNCSTCQHISRIEKFRLSSWTVCMIWYYK